jgi:tungstate transport system substrate-binding protein
MAADGDKFIFLSSTIGPIDFGIVSALEDQFEKETGIRVRHVGSGTGAALTLASIKGEKSTTESLKKIMGKKQKRNK